MIAPLPDHADVDALAAVTVDHYTIRGIAVDRYEPRSDHRRDGKERPPVVFVHGGGHAAWCFERYGRFLADHGYPVHALSWYLHGRSAHLPETTFLNRSIASVGDTEIAHVVDALGQDPILVGHSMGGLAAQLYAARRPVRRLALLASGLPAQVRAPQTPIDIDLGTPFEPPPFEVARHMFFTTMTESQARDLYPLLEAESPRAVWEVTRHTLWYEPPAFPTPTLVLAAGRDGIFAPGDQRRLAAFLDADFVEIPDVGHSDLLLQDGAWRTGAGALLNWLDGK